MRHAAGRKLKGAMRQIASKVSRYWQKARRLGPMFGTMQDLSFLDGATLALVSHGSYLGRGVNHAKRRLAGAYLLLDGC